MQENGFDWRVLAAEPAPRDRHPGPRNRPPGVMEALIGAGVAVVCNDMDKAVRTEAMRPRIRHAPARAGRSGCHG